MVKKDEEREFLQSQVIDLFNLVASKFEKRARNKLSDKVRYAIHKSTLKSLINKFTAVLEQVKDVKQTVKLKDLPKIKSKQRTMMDELKKITKERQREVRKYENKALGGIFNEIILNANDLDGFNGIEINSFDALTIDNLSKIKRVISNIIMNKLENVKKADKLKGLRCFITIQSILVDLINKKYISHDFNGKLRDIPTINSIGEFTNDNIEAFKNNIEKSYNGSGWAFYGFDNFRIKFNVYKMALGKSFIPLPKAIADKKACINPKNDDDKCFDWCLLIHKFYDGIKAKDKNEIKYYRKYWDEIKRPDNIEYPITEDKIALYEELNDMQINVFELIDYDESKDAKSCIQQLYKSNQHRKDVVNLMLIKDGDKSHYVVVKTLSRLFSSNTLRKSKFICPHCLIKSYPSQDKLDNHISLCSSAVGAEVNRLDIEYKCAEEGKNIMKFINHNRKFKHPFHIIADFESTLEKVECDKNGKTQKYQKHLPNSFGLKFCSIYKEYDEDVIYFNSSNPDEVIKTFVQTLEDYSLKAYKYMIQNRTNIIDKEEVRLKHNEKRFCEECNEKFDNNKVKRVMHHCHITGKYIGALCTKCNLDFKLKRFLPVYLHNLKGYDSHLFVTGLNKYGMEECDVSCIPNNEERYISFSKSIQVDEYKDNDVLKPVSFEIRMLDTIAFMNSSVEALVENLAKGRNTMEEMRKAFPNTSKHFTDDEQFKLMTMKGIYPYDYIDSFDRMNETKLPEQKEFYSKLYDSDCSDEDYEQALNVWNKFKCVKFLDYHNLYLKSDVLLLADVWESFRDTCFKNYNLDCLYYYTAPGLSFDAMLKLTGIELELLTEIEMYEFVESGIRGGLSQISKRYAKANNKYMSNYDNSKYVSYILYLDANNLYAWAMIQFMPCKNFKWNKDEWNLEKIMTISNTSDKGYMFEVDLHIPEELHDYFNNYVPCPESISVKKDYLSEWQQINYKESKITKLCTTFFDKKKYVVNYRYLQLVLSLGVELKGVHRVLEFNQKPFLKEYIELNTKLRTKATTDFEKDFFKLMNNSVFGKTMENVRNRINFELVNTEEQAWRVKNLNRFTIFDDNLVGVHKQKQVIHLNKPVYLGQTILDDSKYLMYDFHYNFMLKKIPREDIDLLFTDTDSLCYHVRNHDVFEIMKNNKEYFDLSDYPKDNELYDPTNKKVIGKFKNESIKQITEFIGLRAKLYAFTVDGEKKKHLKCKGVKKNVAKRDLNIDKYRDVLFNRSIEKVTQNGIRSYAHQLYTESSEKIALSSLDDKVYIMDDNINTLNFGHKNILNLS